MNPINLHAYFHHKTRHCRQTLFLLMVMMYALVMFFGHVPIDQKTVVAVTESEPRLPAVQTIVAYIPIAGYFELKKTNFTLENNSSTMNLTNATDHYEPAIFQQWRTTMNSLCRERLELYGNEFAHLRRVVVDRNHCKAGAKGGEQVNRVINQPEQVEYYNQITNCFQMECDMKSSSTLNSFYRFHGSYNDNYLNGWLTSMKKIDVDASILSVNLVESRFTIAITRHEYANLYHTLTDWYNSFIVMKFFEKTPNETDILFVDAHPRGHLDHAWEQLFHRVYFLSELPQRTIFNDLVWGIQGYNSLIKHNLSPMPPPYMEDFRSFFLSGLKVKRPNRTLNCSAVVVTFLWRHDYVAHPRNPSGIIQRKIDNEEEILENFRRSHPEFVVRGVQIDKLSIEDQLQMIADTDVLIGMHGAGLAHVAFVPVHGALVELFPSYYQNINRHMVNLARWRGMTFLDWHSNNRLNELPGFRTRVPVNTVNWLLEMAASKICNRPEPPLLGVREMSGIVSGTGIRQTYEHTQVVFR